jgi:hypothetical protein
MSKIEYIPPPGRFRTALEHDPEVHRAIAEASEKNISREMEKLRALVENGQCDDASDQAITLGIRIGIWGTNLSAGGRVGDVDAKAGEVSRLLRQCVIRRDEDDGAPGSGWSGFPNLKGKKILGMPWWAALGGGVIVLVGLGKGASVIAPGIKGRILNGPIAGRATTINPETGLISVGPGTLASEAKLDLDVYSLARMMSSEHGNQADAYLVAVGWAVRNEAKRKGITITKLVTDGAGGGGSGYYGQQKAKAGIKYVSTAIDPRKRHVDVALKVRGAPSSADPTGGATNFYSPKAQDALAKKAAEGDPRYVKYAGKDAAAIEKSWSGRGLQHAKTPAGVDPRELTLWRYV